MQKKKVFFGKLLRKNLKEKGIVPSDSEIRRLIEETKSQNGVLNLENLKNYIENI